MDRPYVLNERGYKIKNIRDYTCKGGQGETSLFVPVGHKTMSIAFPPKIIVDAT